jgi:hypothetical protein
VLILGAWGCGVFKFPVDECAGVSFHKLSLSFSITFSSSFLFLFFLSYSEFGILAHSIKWLLLLFIDKNFKKFSFL